MTATTKWQAGTLAAAWTLAFNTADLTALATGASVLSGLTFDNSAALDQFMDLSFVGTCTSSTIASGAGIGLNYACFNGDGTTQGNGRMTQGAQVATFNSILNPIGGIPIDPGATVTVLAGLLLGVTLPPEKFGLVAFNNVGFTFTGSLWIKTYRQNVNA